MEGEGGHGTLVAYVEYEIVVGLYRVVQPLYLRRNGRRIVLALHEKRAVGVLLLIVGVEVIAAGVGKEQRALVGAVDI